eukprot:Gb_00645 [translate_table: standard]
MILHRVRICSSEKRLNIAIFIAHGLSYLHHNCSVQVVHCDLKPGNVLMNDSMTARVSDFGIAQLTSSATYMDSLASTVVVKRTIGYIFAPGRVSTRGDVYSYGILLFEMLTRKLPTDSMLVGELNLQKWVRGVFLIK